MQFLPLYFATSAFQVLPHGKTAKARKAYLFKWSRISARLLRQSWRPVSWAVFDGAARPYWYHVSFH